MNHKARFKGDVQVDGSIVGSDGQPIGGGGIAPTQAFLTETPHSDGVPIVANSDWTHIPIVLSSGTSLIDNVNENGVPLVDGSLIIPRDGVVFVLITVDTDNPVANLLYAQLANDVEGDKPLRGSMVSIPVGEVHAAYVGAPLPIVVSAGDSLGFYVFNGDDTPNNVYLSVDFTYIG